MKNNTKIIYYIHQLIKYYFIFSIGILVGIPSNVKIDKNYYELRVILGNLNYFSLFLYLLLLIIIYIVKFKKYKKENIHLTILGKGFITILIFVLLSAYSFIIGGHIRSTFNNAYHTNNLINETKSVVENVNNKSVTKKGEISIIKDTNGIIDLGIENKNFTNNSLDQIISFCDDYVKGKYACIVNSHEYIGTDEEKIRDGINLIQSGTGEGVSEGDFILLYDHVNNINIPLHIKDYGHKFENGIIKTLIGLKIGTTLETRSLGTRTILFSEKFESIITKKITEEEFFQYSKILVKKSFIEHDNVKGFYLSWPKIQNKLELAMQNSKAFSKDRNVLLYIKTKNSDNLIKIYKLGEGGNIYGKKYTITINNKRTIVSSNLLPVIDFDHMSLIYNNKFPVGTQFFYNKLDKDFEITSIENE